MSHSPLKEKWDIFLTAITISYYAVTSATYSPGEVKDEEVFLYLIKKMFRLPYPIVDLGCSISKITKMNVGMKQVDFTFRRAGFLLLFSFLLCFSLKVGAQTERLITLDLKNELLPDALKKIEKAGGKNILFTYVGTENFRVTADIRQKTEKEAIHMVLQNKPFVCLERDRYFVVQLQDNAAATRKVYGRVYDETNTPLAYANVVALEVADSTFVIGCVTAEDGSFSLPLPVEGDLLLKVTYVGYQSQTVPCRQENEIRMTSDNQLLKEVKVTATRPLVERKSGGFLTHVQGTPLALLGTANDMIPFLPFVQGYDGSYTVFGRGAPEIYINGRKVRDDTELDRLQAGDILSAEVITSPGAQYGASVSAVIRIRTIRKQGQGLSGNLYTDYSQGRVAQSSQGASLNYRVGGVDVFLKGDFEEEDYNSRFIDRQWLDGSSSWYADSRRTFRNSSDTFNGEVGVNYTPDDKQSMGVRYVPNTNLKSNTALTSIETTVQRDDEEVDRLHTMGYATRKPKWNHAVNGYYNGTFGKWNIDINADYASRQGWNTQLMENNGEEAAVYSTDAHSKLYAAKLVATVGGWKGKLSFGSENMYTDRHQKFVQSGFSADADDRIKQAIFTGFADYRVSLGKWGLSAGVRYEHQQVDYYEAGVKQAQQSPIYNDWLPNVSADYSTGEWSFDFSYRLLKFQPSYEMLSSSIYYMNKYEYLSKNPQLRPGKCHMLSLNGGWKWVNLTAFYQYQSDSFTTLSRIYDDVNHPGVVEETVLNVPRTTSWGAAISVSPKFGCWNPRIGVSVSWLDEDIASLGVTASWHEPNLLIDFNHFFTFSHGWSVILGSYYSPKCKSGHRVDDAMGKVNVQVLKSFLKDRSLKVRLGMYDVFGTEKMGSDIYGDHTRLYRHYDLDSQRVGVRVAWAFNAAKSKYKGTGAGRSEKNRL